MTLKKPKSLWRKNFKGLQLNSKQEQVAEEPDSMAEPQLDLQQDRLPVGLELGVELNLSMRKEDLQFVSDLGAGNGGTVSKVLHVPTGTLIAKKVIYLETNPKVQKSIMQELETLQVCESPYIVKYFGQFVEAKSVTICMEFMDCSSLDNIYKSVGPLRDPVLAAITVSIVDGLNYLRQLSITHRDIKPSNILVNSKGEIKLCDFGVSGVLINSIAETFVGTSTYMSPERISGEAYSSTGDVWSLGLTVVELAKGSFPFETQSGHPFSIFDLLQRIVNEPPPTLPAHCIPEFQEFTNACLQSQPEHRTPLDQLVYTKFYAYGRQQGNILAVWAASLPRI